MRTSPPPPPTASSCSSSSSSCVGFDNIVAAPHREKTRAKRKRKNQDESKCKINTTTTTVPGGGSSGRRSSIYRGVTRHRWTGRFEAHLWDKSSWNSIQNKKGRQVYLGAYDNEEAAARTYDLAALKYWGPGTTLNFPLESHAKEIEEMVKVSKEEYLASLRRRSSGFSRGVSKYRGVARHHHNGRWEARIGRVFGSKYLYLGTYNTQEEAAAAYDMAAIEYRGANAVTNFDISNYIGRLENKPSVFPAADKPTLLPHCSPSSEEDDGGEGEGEVEQQLQQQQLQQQTFSPRLPYSPSLPSIDNNHVMVSMEPTEEHDLHWSFLDTGFAQFPVHDLPLDKSGDLADLFFDEIEFEDNIDLIFESTVLENESCDAKEDVLKIENSEERRLSSTTSPSSSTTTSVSCEFRV